LIAIFLQIDAMWILSFFILSATAGTTYYIKKEYDKKRNQANITNVLRILRRIWIIKNKLPNYQENIVEAYLVRRLSKYFGNIETQKNIGGRKGAREKIDIDIENGKVGIELKLAKSLKNSNERNRLLGQLDLYLTRKYTVKNLLLVIVGEEAEEKSLVIKELIEIIRQKNITFFYLKVI